MTTEPQQKLMQALKFTEVDLAANRDGFMSENQKAHWRRRRKLTTRAFRLGQIIVVLLLAGMVQLAVQRNGVIWLAFIAGLMGLTVLWTVGDLLNPATDYQDDLRKGHVYGACGNIKLWAVRIRWQGRGFLARPYYSYKLQIENVEFRVSSNQYTAFHDKKQYCIYYMPDSKIVLSAETID